MPISFQVVKASAMGEQLTASIVQCNPVTGEREHDNNEMEELLNNAVAALDERMIVMNMRLLEAQQLQPYCHPSVWIKVQQVMEVLCGRMGVELLKARWQSEIEETADLEAERAKHAAQKAIAEEHAFYDDMIRRGECTCSSSMLGCKIHNSETAIDAWPCHNGDPMNQDRY
jgi:translation elongation factor EF-Ts